MTRTGLWSQIEQVICTVSCQSTIMASAWFPPCSSRGSGGWCIPPRALLAQIDEYQYDDEHKQQYYGTRSRYDY